MTSRILTWLRRIVVAITAGAAVSLAMAQSQPAQVPLLTRGAGVEPNILFIFDDSASMNDTYLYQDSSTSNWGGYAPSIGVNGVQANGSADTYAACSPEVNFLYYDPTQNFLPYQNADGSYGPSGTTTTAWDTSLVCTSGSRTPLTYRYKGTGTYNLSSSYTVTTLTSTISSYTKYPARTDCAGATCTYAEEILNFANWYYWNSDRLTMATTAISQAFSSLGSTFRLGWGKINSLGSSTASSNHLDSGVSLYNTATRARFYSFLRATATGSTVAATPNKRALESAGKYYSRTDSDGPWGSTPNYSSTAITSPGTVSSTEPTSAHASCRRSYTLLVTDGYWNDSSPPSVGNVDNTTGSSIPNPSGASYSYSPVYPYKDSASDTMADIAMKYWVTDLRTDIANGIKPIPGVNPAFWQHMTFYAIGLGLNGTLPQTATTLASLTSGSITWPSSVSNNTIPTIDDMWHATINSRGGMLNAGNANQLSSSIQSMVSQILKASASQAGVAVSTVTLTSGTKKYVPVYTTGEWTGNVIANSLDPTTGNETTISWQVEIKDSITGLETTNTLGNFNTRNIYVGNAATSGSRAVSFTYAAMSSASLLTSMTGTVTTALISYLRGDRSQEGATGIYRGRALLLGDVVNSTPNFIKPGIDFGYGNLPAGTPGLSSYAAFLTAMSARPEGALFVGANDGMVHAFAENDGREVFAYVPRSVLPNMAQLADNAYVHRFYVDGPVTEGQYYDGSNWKNIVVGTTGAGAKSVFALDVTSPITMSATSVMWEVNNGVSGFSELGYVLTDVQTGVTVNNTWVAVFGNGYYSASGTARLFVVNLNTGALIRVIDTAAGPNNGLGGVRLALNSSRQIIGAYGGDLLGNLWKFDLNDNTAANWHVGLSGAPLFKAKDSTGAAQPITAIPFVMDHPSNGKLVVIGTGKLFDSPDVTTTGVQTVYGLQDTVVFGTTTTPAGGTISGTASLVLQTVSQDITVSRVVTAFDNSTSTQVVTFYTISANPINWATQRGWYFTMPNSGQRMIYPIDALYQTSASQAILEVQTLKPGANITLDPCAAAAAGTGYNYVIDALTGGSPATPIFDTNGDGNIDSSDYVGASGYTTTADGRDISLLKPGSTTTNVSGVILDSSGAATSFNFNCVALNNCASPKSIGKRSFRQLFMR